MDFGFFIFLFFYCFITVMYETNSQYLDGLNGSFIIVLILCAICSWVISLLFMKPHIALCSVPLRYDVQTLLSQVRPNEKTLIEPSFADSINMVACWTANDLVKGGAVVFAWMPPNNFVVRCIFHECMKSIKKFRIPLVEVELISSGSEIGCAPSLKINSINRPIFKVFFIILILINYYCKDSWCLVHYFKLLLLRHGNRQRMQISIKNKFSPHCLLRSKFSVRPHVICLEKQFGHGPFILCWISLVRHPTGSSHDHCRGPITQLSFVLR
jgi:hypothetical protein